MITVRQLLAKKGGAVWTVPPDATVLTALRLMDEKNAGAVMVVEEGRLVGIFSERDFARMASRRGALPLDMLMKDSMVRLVYFVTPDQTIDACMEYMTNRRIRHLPVMEDNVLIGVVSIGDVVKELITDRESTIENLENFIWGTGYGQH